MSDPVVACENIPRWTRLTCIVPVRATAMRSGAVERLRFFSLDGSCPADVGVLVVDDGSEAAAAEAIQRICQQNGYGYIRLDTENSEFSVGRCRNHGAMYATSKYVLFQDVDLMPYDGLYQSILNEIEIQGLEQNARDFLMFGCVYLTETATNEYINSDPAIRRQLFLHYALAGSPEKIEKISTGTSVNVYNREYYLARGGNSPEFNGWGYEDLEFNTRCIRISNRFPTPRDWQVDRKNFMTVIDYSGWKASYRLFGDLTFAKGIAFFHAWHPVQRASGYMQCKEKNRRIFQKRMADFTKFGTEPDPLPSKEEGRTLLFRSNPFVYQREIRPRLGDIVLINEDAFADANEFETFVREQSITRVMFHNPYQNDRMRNIYERCREAGIPLVVGERGALRDSLFFDHSGFLADGDSYSASRWDRPLGKVERERILDYIYQEKKNDGCLESQGERRSPSELRRSLGILEHKKVLLVTLQRPTDSVTRFFCGEMGAYDNFIAMVGEVAKALPWNWTMIIRKHPLEEGCPEFDDTILDEQSHIKDLIELSDAVLTLNSGTGVLAMLWGKPVYYSGRAFYGHEGLNQKATSAGQLLEYLEIGFRPDWEKTLRFLHYLVFEFYSFGKFVTRETRMPDGSRMTATTEILFRAIRGLGQHETRYVDREVAEVGWESCLLDRYRFAEQQHRDTGKPDAAGASTQRDIVVAHMRHAGQNRSSSFSRKIKKLVNSPSRFFADMRLVKAVGGT